jgi:hypothetical protein
MFNNSVKVAKHLGHDGAAVLFRSQSHGGLAGDAVSRLVRCMRESM